MIPELTSISSRVIYGVGIALAMAAISSIFVTMVAAQSTTQSGQTQASPSQSSQSNQSQGSGANQQSSQQQPQGGSQQQLSGSATDNANQQQGQTSTASQGNTGSSNQTSPSGQQSSQQPQTQTQAANPSGAQPQYSGSNISQALQQAGQLLVQAGNTLQQAGTGTQTQSSSATPAQSTAGQQSQRPQGAMGGGGAPQSQQSTAGAQPQQQPSSQPQPQQQQSSQQQPTQPSSPQSQSQSSSTSSGNNVQIEIPQGAQSGQNGYYIPSNAQVSPGAKVTWNNKDSVTHTATANDGSFDTGIIQPGQSGSATIQGQGKIPYYCTVHPWMVASLTVGGGSAGGQQPQQQQSQTTTSSSSQQQPSSQPQPQQQGSQQQQLQQSGGGGQQQQAGASQPQGHSNQQTQQQQQQGQTQTTSAEGFPIRTHATAFQVLPKSTNTDLGTEPEHKNDWITANHDIFYTRSSQQTTIGKNNVDKLQVKWILNSDFPIENPPLIIGDRGYAQDNAMRVLAFDMNTGLNLWKFDPGVADKQSQQLPRGVFSHGMTYDQGVIFAPTGANGTIVALNATDGKLIWQSASIGDPRLGYRLPSPPIVWKDYVIAGSALGDEPPFSPAAKGSITAFNRTNGEKIWNISTVTGEWVQGENATHNGGATVWSGGSFDPQTGIIYLPTGNAAPDFDASTRPPPNPYTSSIIAVDIRTGKILWDTVSVSATDEHDWDTAWGTSLAHITSDNGKTAKVVLAQNKRGEAFALDAVNGAVLWNKTLAVQFRTYAQPQPYGSGEVWPGSNEGIEDYNANDNETAYFAASNMGYNYFTNAQGTSGHLKPVFDAIANGIGNGTITAVDVKTGKIKWEHPTEYPTWVSPLVTNGVVFSGHITATGKPYPVNSFGAPTDTPLLPSGIILALDKDTGKKLWEFNVGAPVGIGGPSIGHGTLLVTTGSPAEIGSNKGGYIIAFGLPGEGGNANTTSVTQGNNNNSTETSSAANQNMTGTNSSNNSGNQTATAATTTSNQTSLPTSASPRLTTNQTAPTNASGSGSQGNNTSTAMSSSPQKTSPSMAPQSNTSASGSNATMGKKSPSSTR